MIQFEQVIKSYSGAIGCMCGCNGNYSVASHYGVEAANKEVGYEAYDKCSDRAVKIAISKLNKMINWNNPAEVAKYVTDEYAYFETETRNIVVYFK